ncbi:hypothetical protein SNEBB_001627 [Seison nebaliae]|nr:hypothetical protein SNEBB_001627 [Seison nebaliae]
MSVSTRKQCKDYCTVLSTKLCRRPDKGGSQGRSIQLLTNWYSVQLPKELDIVHYHISYEKLKDAEGTKREDVRPGNFTANVRKECMKIFAQQYKQFEYCGYDGQSSAYLPSSIKVTMPASGFLSKIVHPKNDEIAKSEFGYEMKVKKVDLLNVSVLHEMLNSDIGESSQASVQAISVIYRTMLANKFQNYNRFFANIQNDSNFVDLGEGKVQYPSVYSSLRCGQKGWYQNVDIVGSCFYMPIELDKYFAKAFDCGYNRQTIRIEDIYNPQNRHVLRQFGDDVRGLKVIMVHINRGRRVNGISNKCADELAFEIDGRKVTVAQYYRMKYPNIRINGKYPCATMGNLSKPSYVPVQLCRIVPGVRSMGKLSANQTTVMIKKNAQPAMERCKMIDDWVNKLRANDNVLEHFGFCYSPKMLQLAGRVLEHPSLKYQGSNVRPESGKWRNANFEYINHDYIRQLKWMAITFDEQPRFNYAEFINRLCGYANRTCRLPLNQPVAVRTMRRNDNLLRFLETEKSRNQISFIIVCIRTDKHYSDIKTFCELKLGIMTQCIKSSNIDPKRSNPNFLQNLCLKINEKLKGINYSIPSIVNINQHMKNEPTICFGADVTHSVSTVSVSIAAVVGSLNPLHTKYHSVISKQTNPKESRQSMEMILKLDESVKTILIEYYKSTKKKPSSIIFYRDGVSEGQYDTVLNYELDLIKKACRMLPGNYSPKITLIVVGKRHHTRLFPQNRKDAVGRSGNVPAGTVVDTNIVDPKAFDFYLCSHEGIMGTSKPSHYIVLHDENGFTSDSIQRFTFDLCHLYARCTRSVSIPAPVYYAHLAAYRARAYNENDVENVAKLNNNTLASIIKLNDAIKGEMFFV